GGVESMTRAPLALAKPEHAFPRGDRTAWDTTIGWRFPNPRLEAMFPLEPMGETGENVAERYGVTREEQDAFALESQRRWAAADAAGRFADELVSVGDATRDEHPRPETTPEKLAALAPAFRELLDRVGLDAAGLDLVELNEAFASQSLVVIRELGFDPERVNVNGGAIAIGHPLGMSGARLVVTLLHELGRRGGHYGRATLCVGVGQGQAALFERL